MTTSRIAAQLITCLVLASICFAQGMRTKRDAVILFGSAANCGQPSTIHYKRVQKATPEWRTIKTEGVKKGSARYDLLISGMNSRIKTAVASVAQAESRDCVVRTGDIKDAGGQTVTDLTDAVIDELIVEAVALICLNSFCNYVSSVANTAPDHPAPVSPKKVRKRHDRSFRPPRPYQRIGILCGGDRTGSPR